MIPMFSAYPGGAAGTALLLLRLSTAMFLIPRVLETAPSEPFWAAALSALALLLSFGLLTRLASCAATAYALVGLATPGSPTLTIELGQIFAASALALIGAGGFSIDARLFGRKEIHVPPGRRTKV